MPLNYPPLGYTGEVETFSNTSQTKEGIVRAATQAEVTAGTRPDVYVSPLTLENKPGNFPITPFVVGPVGQAGYQTIQSAINAVQANGNVGQIWIFPGTYTENLVFPNGFTGSLITGSDESAGSVVIVGTHTPGLTGSIVTWRVALTAGASGHIFSSNAAGACNIICVHNNFICNGYIFNLPNWTAAAGLNIGYMADRNSTASGVINNTGGAFFGSFDNSLGVGTTFPAIISGPALIQSNNWGCPIQTQGSASLNFYDSNFNDQITLGGATSGSITRTKHITGANPALTYSSSGNTLFTQSTITSTNNPAIAGAGAGTLTLGDIVFTSNAVVAGTLTVAYASSLNGPTTIAGATTITTGGLLVSGGDIINSHSNAGTDVTIEVTNSDNTNGASRAGVEIATGGASSGDPYLSFQISGVGASTMTMGLDNSASDLFVISNSTAVGTSNALTLSQAGALTATTSITATLGAITATNGSFTAVAAGTGLVLPVGTASGGTPQIVDARVGSVTFTSISIAAAADSTLVLTNSTITGASTRVMLSMSGATTGSALSIKSVTPSAGSLSIVVTNGTGATTTTADITFDFIVLN